MARIVDGLIDNFVRTLDFGWAVAASRVSGVQSFNITGRNPSLNSGVYDQELWSLNTPPSYPDLDSPVSGSLVSDSAQDAPGGTGISAVLVDGLGTALDPVTGILTDGVRQSEIVTMNGTTSASLQNQYSRIFALRGTSAGSSQKNVGTITLTLDGFGTQAQIVVDTNLDGEGVSKRVQRTIPANHIGVLWGFAGLIDRSGISPEVAMHLMIRLSGTNVWSREFSIVIEKLARPTEYQLLRPSVLPALTDITVIAVPDTNSTPAEARLNMTISRIPAS